MKPEYRTWYPEIAWKEGAAFVNPGEMGGYQMGGYGRVLHSKVSKNLTSVMKSLFSDFTKSTWIR